MTFLERYKKDKKEGFDADEDMGVVAQTEPIITGLAAVLAGEFYRAEKKGYYTMPDLAVIKEILSKLMAAIDKLDMVGVSWNDDLVRELIQNSQNEP